MQLAFSESKGLWVMSLFLHQNENKVALLVQFPVCLKHSKSITTFWCMLLKILPRMHLILKRRT